MSLIRLSDEGFCATEKVCFNPRYKAPKKMADKYKKEWCAKHRLFMAMWGGDHRVVALVGVKQSGEKKLRAYFMDALTGSLFSARSLCLPASNVCISDIKRDQAAAAKWIRSYVPAGELMAEAA